MRVSKKKLGILLSTPPKNENLKTVVSLALAARHQRIETYLYLIDEGTLNLDRVEMEDLQRAGVRLFVCAYGAERHGVSQNDRRNDRMTFCGLVVLSDLIKGCDRFVTFN